MSTKNTFLVWKILSFYSFEKYSFPDFEIIANPQKGTRLECHMTRHTRQLFSSNAVCKPNFSYIMETVD